MAKAPSYVEEDHRLEEVANSGQESLARHRWHWTLNEDNPDRATIREYARNVGRHRSTITRHAQGYATWTEAGGSTHAPRSLNDYIELVLQGEEKTSAIEAVAAAKDISAAAVLRTHGDEVRNVRDLSRDLAEARGVDAKELHRDVASLRERGRRGAENAATRKAANRTLRYIELEGELGKARRILSAALRITVTDEFTDEEKELIEDSISRVVTLAGLIQARFTGESGVDWDAELASLTGD